MLVHPSVLMDLANDRNRAMIVDADRDRVLALVRCVRRGRKKKAARARPAGTLASCEQSVAVPVR